VKINARTSVYYILLCNGSPGRQLSFGNCSVLAGTANGYRQRQQDDLKNAAFAITLYSYGSSVVVVAEGMIMAY
jgi:hypothetical protein